MQNRNNDNNHDNNEIKKRKFVESPESMLNASKACSRKKKKNVNIKCAKLYWSKGPASIDKKHIAQKSVFFSLSFSLSQSHAITQ